MHLLQNLGGDLRHAARSLRRSPLFAVVAVAVIALGTGGVTTVFSALDAILLRPLPGTTEPARLVDVERTGPHGEGSLSASGPYYERLREARTLAGVTAWSKADLTIAEGEDGWSAAGNLVSGNYFDVLGVTPAAGRFFRPEEDGAPLAHPVLVVSHAFWSSRLGADPGAIGRTLQVNGRPFTLVGVAPEGFRGVFTPLSIDAWAPLAMTPALRPGRQLDDPAQAWLRVFGRLEDGVEAAAAQAEIASLTAGYVAEAGEPDEYRAFSGARVSRLTGLPSDAQGPFLGFMGLLLAAASLVLLIASVNVAATLSARAVERRREMAVRAALGARRGRLLRQLLTETLLLFAVGGAGGAGLAVVATAALERIPLPADAGVSLEISPDLRVLAFAIVAALGAGVVAGLAPALRGSRADVASRLRDGSGGSVARRSRFAGALVVAQLAGSMLLLVGAGLFVRALDRGQGIDPGFEVQGVATMKLDAGSWGYDEARTRAFFDSLRERVEGMPGVAEVSYAGFLPLAWGSSGDTIVPDRAAEGEELPVEIADVGPGYFDVLRMPLLRGRGFLVDDRPEAPPVAVVNETLARALRPDGDALGATFAFRGETVTVVGIARDAKYASLGESPTPAFAYFPIAQLWRDDHTLLVRTAGDPAALAPALAAAVAELDPTLPRPEVIPLAEATRMALLPQRIAAGVTAALGAIGLLLATVGLYGTIAMAAARRSREIGVRVALGARRADVLRLVVRQGVRLAAVGVAVGLALAAVATQAMKSLLLGVSPLDPVTFGGMALLFLTVALVASLVPARRAAAADPIRVLRAE